MSTSIREATGDEPCPRLGGAAEAAAAGTASSPPPSVVPASEADPGLDVLLDALAAEPRPRATGPDPFGEGTWPDRATWLDAVRAARAHADAAAIAHEARVDELSATLLGQSAREALGLPPADLTLERRSIQVPVGVQLADLVPSLRGRAPRGPLVTGSASGSGCGGTYAEVALRVLRPPAPRRTVVRLHGGGFWMGGSEVLERVDALLLETLAVRLEAVVVDVDHRLAPEHPYPAAVVDALTVLDAVAAATGRDDGAAPRAALGGLDAPLDLPAGGVALVGTSSGANAAALASIVDAERSKGSPASRHVDAVALIEPSVDLASVPPAMLADGVAWEHRVRQLRAHAGEVLSLSDPWVSPAHAAALHGLPPVLVIEAARDEVARGGPELARAIRTGGGEATEVVLDMTHTVATPRARAAIATAVTDFLDEHLS